MKLSSAIPTLALATALASSWTNAMPAALERRQSDSQGFYTPTANGGSMLTGSGEPLNVIISDKSSPGVLYQAGFEEFARSVYYSPGSCLNISEGGYQTANLGDGNGNKPQTNIFRYNFKQGDGGTCLESLNGGNHFRYWIQNGSAADSNAIFMAVSVELNATYHHDIAPNGYDNGRDEFVNNATAGTLTSPGGFQYTVSKTTNNLLSGISASQINHDIGIDGVVDVLTVTITKNGTIGANRGGSSGSSSGSSSTPQSSAALPSFSVSNTRLVAGMGALVLALTSGLLVVF